MILVASTIPAYIASTETGYWGSWLSNAQILQQTAEVQFFASLETDARGIKPFKNLIDRLQAVGGTYTTFSYDDNSEVINYKNRLVRIITGRNIINYHAMDNGYSHIFFLDADIAVPNYAITELLEMDWPIVGLNVGAYQLTGPNVEGYPEHWDVREHWNTAGCLLVQRKIFTRVYWRVNFDIGLSDDPCYASDAKDLGYPTRVRHDIQGVHFPASIATMESRYDETLRRYHHIQ